MDSNDVAVSLGESTQIHQAEGMLAVLLGLPIDEAVVSLDRRARLRGVSLYDAAVEIITTQIEGAGEVVPELADQTLAVLRRHLDPTSSRST